jgi:hypothetical protein
MILVFLGEYNFKASNYTICSSLLFLPLSYTMSTVFSHTSNRCSSRSSAILDISQGCRVVSCDVTMHFEVVQIYRGNRYAIAGLSSKMFDYVYRRVETTHKIHFPDPKFVPRWSLLVLKEALITKDYTFSFMATRDSSRIACNIFWFRQIFKYRHL